MRKLGKDMPQPIEYAYGVVHLQFADSLDETWFSPHSQSKRGRA